MTNLMPQQPECFHKSKKCDGWVSCPDDAETDEDNCDRDTVSRDIPEITLLFPRTCVKGHIIKLANFLLGHIRGSVGSQYAIIRISS